MSAELTRRSRIHHLFDLQPNQKKVDEMTPTTAKKASAAISREEG